MMSEWMDPQTVERSVFVSPTIPAMSIKVAGKIIRLVPKGTLLDSTTYVVTLGTNIKDLRGNSLAKAFTLSFSTGDYIDTANFSGGIRDDRGNPIPQGFSVFAYLKMDSTAPDPVHTPPAYITQVNADGTFRFQNLKFGTYRVFAVNDLNRNQKFDPGREKIAIAPFDVNLSPSKPFLLPLFLLPAAWDTTGLALKKVSSQPAGRILAQFSKPPAESLVQNPARYKIIPSKSPDDTPHVTAVYPLADASALLILSTPLPNHKYALEIRDLPAADGTPLDTAYRRMAFTGNPLPDTLSPTLLSFYPRREEKHFFPNDTLHFSFSEPVRQPLFTEGFSLSRLEIKLDSTDTLHHFDTLRFPLTGSSIFTNPMEFRFFPDSLPSEVWLEWRINPKKFVDVAGNFSADSTLWGRFSTPARETFGSLAGKVTALKPGQIRLTAALRLGDKRFELSPDKNGYFKIDPLPEGIYRFFGFVDANGNHKFDRGALHPFQFSEGWFSAVDSLSVRARWEIEDFNVAVDSLLEKN